MNLFKLNLTEKLENRFECIISDYINILNKFKSRMLHSVIKIKDMPHQTVK